MKTVVLVSNSRHAVSRRPALTRLEAQAAGLAAGLGGMVRGLHAGPSDRQLREAMGHGLPEADWLDLADGVDPVPALIDHLKAQRPDIVIAGRRGEGTGDTGLVPYALAEALDMPIVADAVALSPGAGHAPRRAGLEEGRATPARPSITGSRHDPSTCASAQPLRLRGGQAGDDPA